MESATKCHPQCCVSMERVQEAGGIAGGGRGCPSNAFCSPGESITSRTSPSPPSAALVLSYRHFPSHFYFTCFRQI